MSLTGLNKGSSFIGGLDVSKPAEVNMHILTSTGMALELGRVKRLAQATKNPTAFLEDKSNLLKGILEGSDGKSLAMNEALPYNKAPDGKDILFVPKMSSLAEEFTNVYNSSRAQGFPDEVCKQEADSQTRAIMTRRMREFSLGFPGLISDTLSAGFELENAQKAVNAQVAGIAPVKRSKKTRKYKKKK